MTLNSILRVSVFAAGASMAALRGQTDLQSPGDCAVVDLRKSEEQGFRVWSPDGSRYLLNKEDSEGTAQIYVAERDSQNLTCITCEEKPNGPKRKRMKMQPRWHPSGRWILIAVERDHFSPPPIIGRFRSYQEGQLQNGLWTNMWAITPDGQEWHRLTDFKSNVKGVGDGYTGPAFTPDGRFAVWSQIMDGNILTYYPFGRWELTLGEFFEENGVLSFRNVRNITPSGMHWNEPGNFHPDNESLVFSGSDLADQQGTDIHILNVRTGDLRNLTASPKVWDEHGVFSANGEKIVFMSAYPYRDDPKASQVLTIKTETMVMDRDGSNLQQITRFREPGSPEYSTKGGIAANSEWSPDGRSLHIKRLFFPKYEYWDATFQGPCGGSRNVSSASHRPGSAVPVQRRVDGANHRRPVKRRR